MVNADAEVAAPETLNEALEHAVRMWPDRVFLRIEGRDVTYAEFDQQVGRLAAGLAGAGLDRGDRLFVLMRNSLACVQTWFAANRLGAVWAPANTEFRGRPLANLVELSAAQLAVVDDDLVEPLLYACDQDDVSLPELVLYGDGARHHGRDLASLFQDTPMPPVRVAPGDTASLLFTSGTTGRSKACSLSHRYFLAQGTIIARDVGMVHDDVLYCPFPFFHADATALTTVPALILGATAAISRRFSASRFWDEIKQTRATVFDFMGATLAILYKAEPRPDDADNPVRVAWGVPLPEWGADFERRFGLQLVTMYGSVEANICVTQPYDQPPVPGSCGRAVPEFDVEVHDPEGHRVFAGSTGEIVVRPKLPSIMFDGYSGNPEATVAAFRNLWFHSGDTGRMDADGNLYFVGRMKEAIRRRGENISAFEIEEALLLHEDVVECAAIGVPSELTEEEVKVCIVKRPGSALSHEDVVQHAVANLARFQVPRFIEFVATLPETPTGKIEKYRLVEHWRTAKTWDRETATSAIERVSV